MQINYLCLGSGPALGKLNLDWSSRILFHLMSVNNVGKAAKTKN